MGSHLSSMTYRRKVNVVTNLADVRARANSYRIWKCDALKVLNRLPSRDLFDLVITSPPYNIGKEYERRKSKEDYIDSQRKIIERVVARTKATGSICWVVGNQCVNSHIAPLDIELHPIFDELGLILRNRIVWRYGHGLHCKRRFSGRYDVVMWYTRGHEYTFNLDAVRVPSKYPSKRFHKGPRAGELSSNPMGKNPEDVWEIPQVKSAHIEKTEHPCQFPVGLAERLLLALSDEGDVIYDPFMGSGSTGVAAAIHRRIFWGSEIKAKYVRIAERRINEALNGIHRYRPHDKPIYDHRQSALSLFPDELTAHHRKRSM